jgi:L-aminopeptidase/D-esterase-like protein
MASIPGVVHWCEENGVGITFARQRIPIVTGAVIFDLNTGRPEVRPDFDAGYAAAAAANAGRVREGSVGAGTGATVAKLMGADRNLKGGIGTASETFGDGYVVGALMVVNAVGDIVDSATGEVIAGPRGDKGAFLDSVAGLRARSRRVPEGNTTIGVVATNARLTKEQANRLATIAHDGMARAIRPVHTTGDGDTMFALATGEREMASTRIIALETLAALAVERAIHKAVRAATPVAGVPSVRAWQRKGIP